MSIFIGIRVLVYKIKFCCYFCLIPHDKYFKAGIQDGCQRARWLSGRVSDSKARGRGVRYLPPQYCVLEQDTFTPRKVVIIPRKRWVHSDMKNCLLGRKHQRNQDGCQIFLGKSFLFLLCSKHWGTTPLKYHIFVTHSLFSIL